MKYHAFISYSHADKSWGDWLHRGIETFRIPKELVGRERPRSGGEVPRRLFPVFRDREELPTSADLGTMLREALDSSRYLVVVCSPRAAASKWVNEEVLDFKRSGRGNQVLCVIVDGEPNASDAKLECFPPGLRHPLTADDQVDVSRFEEPIAADARPQGDGKRLALMKVVAGLAEVGFDELRQRDQERSRRATRRWLASAAALVLVFAALAMFALAQRDRALAEERRVRQTLSRSDFLQADELVTRGEPHAALLHLSRAVVSDPEDVVPRRRLASLLRNRSWPYEAMDPINAEEGGLRDVSPLGDSGDFLVNTSTGYHQVWRRDGEALSPPLMHDEVEWIGPVSFVHVMAPDGGRMASGGRDGNVRIWKMPGGESVAPACDVGSEVTALVSARSGGRLAAGTEKGRVFLIGWDGEQQELLDFRPTDETRVTALALSNDGQSVAAAWSGGEVRTKRLDGEGVRLGLDHPERVNAMAFSVDGEDLITGCQDGGLRVWDMKTGRLKQEMMLSSGVGRIQIAADGASLLVGYGYFSDDWKASLFSLEANNTYVMKFSVSHPNRDSGNRVGSSGFGDCAFSEDGGKFLTWTAMDREVRCWSSTDGRMEMSPFLHPCPVGGAAFREAGEVVTTAADGRIRIWKWSTPLLPEVAQLPTGYWFHGVWSNDSKRWIGLARDDGNGNQGVVAVLERSADKWDIQEIPLSGVAWTACMTESGDVAFLGLLDGGILRVDLENGDSQLVPGLEKVEAEAIKMAESSHLLIATKQGKLIRFDLTNSEAEDEFEIGGDLRFMEINSTGSWALVGMGSSTTWWVSVMNLSKSKKLPGHTLTMGAAAFSESGKYFATADLDGWIQAWSVADEPQLLFRVRQEAEVTAIDFNPDGSVLAVGGRDDRVNCWSLEEGGVLLSSIETRSWVAEVIFNRDGRRILVSDIAGRVGTFDSWTGRWVVDPLGMGDESVSFSWWGDKMFGVDRKGEVYLWDFSPPDWEGLSELGALVSRCEFTKRGALQRRSNDRGLRSELEYRGTPQSMVSWWLDQ